MADAPDITFPTAAGVFNFRVGAVILRDGQVLMVKNDRDPYYYSVGGRVKLHETLEQAVVREAFEETGVRFEIDRLVWVHENFFGMPGVGYMSGEDAGRRYHELAFFYLMKPAGCEGIRGGSYTNDGAAERLEWLPVAGLSDYAVYPTFFQTALDPLPEEVTHVVTVE